MRPRLRSGLDLLLEPARVEASLWRRLRLESQSECREALFDRYVPLARALASQAFYRRSGVRGELVEFRQFAFEGLLQAIDRFDPMRGAPFAAFARRRISGSIADGIARMSEVDAQIRHRHRLEQERLRSLSVDSPPDDGDALAALADLAMGLALGFMLDGTRLVADEASPDPAPSAYESLEYRQLQTRLAAEVKKLPEKEGIIVRQHYENGLSFAQIAELLGLSRGRVSQLHRSAVERLRKRIGRFG